MLLAFALLNSLRRRCIEREGERERERESDRFLQRVMLPGLLGLIAYNISQKPVRQLVQSGGIGVF